MQAALGRFAAAERLPLALRIGVGAGEVAVLDVGGERERRELLVAGAAVPQTTGALERARPGQVVLAQPALGLLERDPGTPARPAVAPAVPDGPGVAALAAPYLPRAMLASLVAGHEEWLAELREITVVFANLPDLDHRAGLDEADEVMRALQGALYRYEGSINKLSLDEKGTSLVAALGLPPLAHEDDPARGVQAALAMREAMAGLGRRVAIGVTTGRAFCGTVGSRWRREYTMLGQVVNLAARLMQEAGDGVLCDAATAEAARSAVAFEALVPVLVKGRAGPVPVYRPGRVRPGRRPGAGAVVRDPLVGREEERERLEEVLRRLTADGDDRAGVVQVLVLEATPARASRDWWPSWWTRPSPPGCRCWPGPGTRSSATPWHAWAELFGRLPAFDGAGLADPPAPGARPARAGPRAPRPGPPAQPGARPGAARERGQRPAERAGRAGRTRDLLVLLLRAVVGDKPTVVVIEDAHWLDSASTGLVLALSRERLPLLLVVATRPRSEVGRSRTSWPGSPTGGCSGPEHRAAGPGPAAAGRGRGPDRPAARDQPRPRGPHPPGRGEGRGQPAVHRGAHPRPARRRPGPGGRRPGRVALRHPRRPGQAPAHTVHGAITSRIDRLSPTQQLTVKVASVIGRAFAVAILREVHPLRQAVARTLAADLNEIERADLTVLDTPSPTSVTCSST